MRIKVNYTYSDKKDRVIFSDIRDDTDCSVACSQSRPKWGGRTVGLQVKEGDRHTKIFVNVKSLAKCLSLDPRAIKIRAQQGALEDLVGDALNKRVWPFTQPLQDAARAIGGDEETVRGLCLLARFRLNSSPENTLYFNKEGIPPFIATKNPEGVNPLITFIATSILGEGSFGIVTKAFDANEGACVVKFAKQGTTRPKSLENEYRLLREIHKERIVEGIQLPPFRLVHFSEKKSPYLYGLLEPEYPEGKTLEESPSDLAVQRKQAAQITQGLAHLHNLEIVHGDIKPVNILVRKGRCDLADFGDARPLKEIKELFDVCTQMRKEPDAVDRLELLFGIHTVEYVADEDIFALMDAVEANDWEMCQRLLKMRDVYALAMTMIESWDFFTIAQADLLAEMADEDYRNRPSAKRIAKAFR